MKVKNINSSSKKTEKQIKDSFALLMKEKLELKNITVTELAKKAGITRSAFYTHYDSIYNLAKEIQDETFSFLLDGLDEINSIKSLDEHFDKIIDYLKKNDEFYSTLLSTNEPLMFTSKLKDIMEKKLISFFKVDKNNIELILTISFFTDGCINLFIRHFKRENNVSLDEINIFMKKMFKKIFE